jgi:hypothetical protein
MKSLPPPIIIKWVSGGEDLIHRSDLSLTRLRNEAFMPKKGSPAAD